MNAALFGAISHCKCVCYLLSASITLTIISLQSKQMLLINLPTQPVFSGFSNLPTCLTDLNTLLKPSIWHTNYNTIFRTVSGMVWLNFLSRTLIFFETWKNDMAWLLSWHAQFCVHLCNCIVNVSLRSQRVHPKEPTWVDGLFTPAVDVYKTMITAKWPTKWWLLHRIKAMDL